jgi:hypothetical protein
LYQALSMCTCHSLHISSCPRGFDRALAVAIVLNNTLDCAPEIRQLIAAHTWHILEVRAVLLYKSDRVAGE